MGEYQVDILDFEDSFTWNIACELEMIGLTSQIIPFSSVQNHLIKCKNNTSVKKILLFGPGPGHPDEYIFLQNHIAELLGFNNYFFMGICLGHQLLWKTLGVGTIQSDYPMHGQSVDVTLPNWNYFSKYLRGKKVAVQKYNSLKLDHKSLHEQLDEHVFFQEESLIGQFKRGITYQFHPESVGTTYRSEFFLGLKNFLYNESDENSNPHRRHLRSKTYSIPQTDVGESIFL